MQAGRLTERIDIFRPTVSQNEFGEQVTELEQIDTCKATAEYISGASERDEQGKEIRYEDQYIFTVYFHVNVKPFDVIEYDGNKFNVIFIDKARVKNYKRVKCAMIDD